MAKEKKSAGKKKAIGLGRTIRKPPPSVKSKDKSEKIKYKSKK